MAAIAIVSLEQRRKDIVGNRTLIHITICINLMVSWWISSDQVMLKMNSYTPLEDIRLSFLEIEFTVKFFQC